MAFTSVLRALGGALAVLGLLACLCGLYAVLMGERGSALSLGYAAAVALFFGVSGLILGQNLEKPVGPQEGVAMLILGWAILPLIAALGFWDRGGMASFSDAYFEAMSALTTTGFSLIDPDSADRAILIWRSALEWGGGYFSILSILVILVALNLAGPGVMRSVLFTIGNHGLFSRFAHITREAGIVYVMLTLSAFLLMLIGGADPFIAANLALSAPATGGMSPVSVPLGAAMPPAALFVVALTMFIGALNYALIYESYRDSVMRGDILRDIESRGLAAAVCLIAFFVWIAAPTLGLGRLIIILHDAVALMSTSARFADPEAMSKLPAPLLLAAVLIGGSALSTAGGLKMARLVLLARHARVELQKLSYPSSVELVRFQGRVVPDNIFIGLWIYFLGFTASLAAVTLGVALSGQGFEISAVAAISALSNAGPLMPVAAGGADVEILNRAGRAVLAIGMALGRVETLGALVLAAPGLWRR